MTPAGNSGVKYNVSEELSTAMEPPHAAKGFEYQIIDDDRHPDGSCRRIARARCTISSRRSRTSP
jgi:hypothetical protein